MEFLFGILLYAFFILAARAFTVLFHELGHAIPAMVLSKERVNVYIGSYGDTTKSKHITVGLLDVWFTPNPLAWQTGLCVPQAKEISINRQIVYTVAGPLTSFAVASILCYLLFHFSLHGSLKTFAIVFLLSTLYDLFTNLSPSNTPIRLANGSITYNDGHSLRQLFAYRKLPREYAKAVALYTDQKFKEAAQEFHAMLKDGVTHEDIYRLAISSYAESRNHSAARALSEDFLMTDKMTSNDYAMAALAFSKCGDDARAIDLYDKALQLDENNQYALNNKGYTLNLLDRFQEAVPLFDKAIQLNPSAAYPYNNRGLAKIKTGKEQEGLADIDHSFKLDGTNSYCYLNLGIYHLDKGEHATALEFFNKAKAMDPTTLDIDAFITKAQC